MPKIQITHPAQDGNGTSVVLDGVEVSSHIAAGGLTFHSRRGQSPLVTLSLPQRVVSITADAEVAFDEQTAALLVAAGWVKEVSA